MAGIDEYQPARPEWRELWQRLPQASRERRFAAARQREAEVKVLTARAPGESERAAFRRLEGTVRTSLRRWQKRYAKYGFDGLVDWRLPPGIPPMPLEMRVTVCALRRADPNVNVGVIVEHLSKHHHFATSETTVKRVLREEGLARRRGPADGAEHSGERHLELGGMKLVEAALEETGYLKALSATVAKQLEKVASPESSKPVDRTGRDEWGRFLPGYNERYRKRSDEAIGPGFASIDSKREGLDPSRLHVSGAPQALIERKLLALMTSPLLGGGRWDGIRVARGALLEELCGFAYMPSTLDLFSRELKYVGVSSTLWEVHARLWLEQTATWGSERNAVVLYIDETNKPVWTELFSQSSKVSSVGRVMPSLESVCFHSGYGVPLWLVTHSQDLRLFRVKTIFGFGPVGRWAYRWWRGVNLNSEGTAAASAQGTSVDGVALLAEQRHDVWVALVVGKGQDFELGQDAQARRQGRYALEESDGLHARISEIILEHELNGQDEAELQDAEDRVEFDVVFEDATT